MAKVRQLFNAVSVEVARRERICHHNRNKHSIVKGGRCLVIKEPNGGYKNYCVDCGTEILDRAGIDLASIRNGLAGT